MLEKGLNGAELSRAAGVSKGQISQYLAGKVEPKLDTAQALADALDKNYKWFYEEQTIDEDVPWDISNIDISTMANVPVPIAAKLCGMSYGSLCAALQQGTCPFGFAAKRDKWSYQVSAYKLMSYLGIQKKEPSASLAATESSR